MTGAITIGYEMVGTVSWKRERASPASSPETPRSMATILCPAVSYCSAEPVMRRACVSILKCHLDLTGWAYGFFAQYAVVPDSLAVQIDKDIRWEARFSLNL